MGVVADDIVVNNDRPAVAVAREVMSWAGAALIPGQARVAAA